MTNPKLSVVMSVYNGAEHLADTIDSILSQTFRDFELIVVNDGSTDDSLSILEKSSNLDSRIKVIDQDNTGLTEALVIGCAVAKGELIARHDNGDRSLSTRFARQIEAFNTTPSLAMSSTGTTFIGPQGEQLSTTLQSPESAQHGLKASSANQLKGPPHHGSVMFKRSIYQEVGGYRREFLVAQDIDLWSRMVELGEHQSITEVLYLASVARSSISFTKREYQFLTAEFIIECTQARGQGLSEAPILERLQKLNQLQDQLQSRPKQSNADYYYFLGSSLANKDRAASRHYLRKALSYKALHFRALAKYLATFLK